MVLSLDIYLSSSDFFEMAVGKGATAKGGVQRKRHEGRKNASSVVYEMNNSTRVNLFVGDAVRRAWEKDQIARRYRKYTDSPISKHVSGQDFPSPAVAAFNVVFG